MIPISNNNNTNDSQGSQRLKADIRQFGALIFAFGITAAFGTLATIATLVGPNSTTVSEGVPLANLISQICQCFFGTLGMYTGYNVLVNDVHNNKRLTGALILSTQLAFMPYITGMVSVGQAARTGHAFIPQSYDPTSADVKFVGAMGIMAIISHGFAYIGTLSFMAFALYAYQSGKVQDRSAGYYRSRLTVYSMMQVLAGLTQFGLGVFVLTKFGNGPLEYGSVGVALYTIYFPEISVFVGLVHILVGTYGVLRSFGIAVGGSEDISHQVASLFLWLCMLVLQLMVQVSYAPGGELSGAAPSRACLMLGMAFMPAFLDSKMRNTPEELDASYYGLDVTDEKKCAGEEP
mmetsp:Transcript_29463/g.45160  ORF Transcript_29463/g.45160 Transcript_29463/m.45160 type:complete len:349 (-) Transcript_29463:101-1147(-)